MVQTNNGGRGQTTAVAVNLRVFQLVGFSKNWIALDELLGLKFLAYQIFLCPLELSNARGKIFNFLCSQRVLISDGVKVRSSEEP